MKFYGPGTAFGELALLYRWPVPPRLRPRIESAGRSRRTSTVGSNLRTSLAAPLPSDRVLWQCPTVFAGGSNGIGTRPGVQLAPLRAPLGAVFLGTPAFHG